MDCRFWDIALARFFRNPEIFHAQKCADILTVKGRTSPIRRDTRSVTKVCAKAIWNGEVGSGTSPLQTGLVFIFENRTVGS